LQVAVAAAADPEIDAMIRELAGCSVRRFLADLTVFDGLGVNQLADVARRTTTRRMKRLEELRRLGRVSRSGGPGGPDQAPVDEAVAAVETGVQSGGDDETAAGGEKTEKAGL